MGDAFVVYHGTKASPKDFEAAPGAEPHDVTVWRSADELLAGRSLGTHSAVLLADEAMVDHLVELRDLPAHVIVIATDEAAGTALGQRVDVSLVGVDHPVARSRVLDAARKLAVSRLRAIGLAREIEQIDDEFHELSRIGMALMHERDRTALLRLILSRGKQLTGSDGAGLLLLRTDEHGVAELYPVAYEIDTRPHLGLPSITFAVDGTSIVGHAALSKQPVVVDDMLKLPEDTTYVASEEFQRRFDYRARSMLAVPMITQRDDVLGVLFFINRKSDPQRQDRDAEDADRYVLPYTERQVRLACALASQRRSLDREREALPSDRAHARELRQRVCLRGRRPRPDDGRTLSRVAALRSRSPRRSSRTSGGPYRDVRFTRAQMRELRFAALLHDFGKVAVREDVLVQGEEAAAGAVGARAVALRLDPPHDGARVLRAARGGTVTSTSDQTGIASPSELRELDRIRELVRAANEPSVLETPMSDARRHREPHLRARRRRRALLDAGGAALPPARARNAERRERAEIEAHVDTTYRFLVQIPWTEDLKNLVTYAYGHHEKLNGTGYPRRLRSEDIPVQTRMITLADIFDALTEGDRPYKPARDRGEGDRHHSVGGQCRAARWRSRGDHDRERSVHHDTRTRVEKALRRRTARTAERRAKPNGAGSRTARAAERRGQPNGAGSRTSRTAKRRQLQTAPTTEKIRTDAGRVGHSVVPLNEARGSNVSTGHRNARIHRQSLGEGRSRTRGPRLGPAARHHRAGRTSSLA